MEAIDLLEV